MLKEVVRLFVDLYWAVAVIVVGVIVGTEHLLIGIGFYLVAMGLGDSVYKNRKLQKEIRDLKEKISDIKSRS